jgi:O-antigen/teichoic acid export membrane protein
MASGAVAAISRNIDYAVMATRLDPASVGFYSRGYALGIEYQRRISAILQRLALPLYSRARTLEDKLVLRSRIVRMQSLVIFPLMGGLIVLAPIVVPLVLGPQWDKAVAPTQILAAAGAINAVETGIGPLLLAVGRPGVLLRWNLTNLVLFVAVVWLVAPQGVVAVCVAVALFRVVRLGASLALLVRRIMGIPLRHIWLDVAPPLCATLALLGVGVAVSAAAGAAGLPAWAWAVTFAVTAPFVYLAVLWRVFPEAFAQLGEMARGVLPARLALRLGLVRRSPGADSARV